MVAAALPESDVHWVWGVFGLLSIPALVAVNAFFVAAESALVAVRKPRVAELDRQGVPRAKAVQDALYQPTFPKPDADVADALELFRRSRRPC